MDEGGGSFGIRLMSGCGWFRSVQCDEPRPRPLPGQDVILGASGRQDSGASVSLVAPLFQNE